MTALASLPDDVWGIVLAGAYPRGRSSFDRLLPRPLLPVVQTPVVAYPLRWLADAGVPGATVCANSAARAVRSVLQGTPTPPLKVDFYEDWMPRGAAGCVRDAGLRTNARTFVVVDGTTIPRINLSALLSAHALREAALTVVVHLEPSGGASGSALSPGGVYVFDRRALDHISEHGFQDIKEALIPKLHAAGEPIAVFKGDGTRPRIYDAESYLRVNRWAISRLACDGVAPEGYRLCEEALVHSTSRLSPHARLVGPVVLGPGVTVEDQATLIGPTAIGSGSVVGRGAVVSRSVIWSNCQLGTESLVDRCLLSDAALVPPRTSLYGALKTGTPAKEPRSHGGSWTFSRVWVEAAVRIRAADAAQRL